MAGGTVRQLSRVHDLPVGAALIKIRRAVFVLGASLNGATGDIELSFDNGQVFSFGVAGDGESLAIDQPSRHPSCSISACWPKIQPRR